MKKFLIIFGSLIIIAGIFCWYFYRSVHYKAVTDKEAIMVEVKEGASSMTIAKDLESIGAIKKAWVFYAYQKIMGKVIRSGTYSLPFNLSIAELVEKFSSGELLLTKVTIPEGKRIEQIAALMEDKKYFGYKEIIDAASGKEGRLFPDTYFIGKKTTAAEFVLMMTENFDKKTAGLNLTNDELVLASIVEREAIVDEERPLIAGIYKNRLNINMKLEADPTTLYASDSEKLVNITPYEATQYVFWQPIKFSLYKTIESPYNTYLYGGLPPKPICSPGIASIKAAQNPQKTDYIFFLHGSDGNIHPAKDNTEHEKNKDLYL